MAVSSGCDDARIAPEGEADRGFLANLRVRVLQRLQQRIDHVAAGREREAHRRLFADLAVAIVQRVAPAPR